MKKTVLISTVCLLVLGGSWTVAAGSGGSGPGPKLTTRIVTETGSIGDPLGDFESVVALCDAGEVVTGGGMEVASINPAVAVVTNAPTADYDSTGLQGWIVTLAWDEPTEFEAAFTSFAICAPGSQVRGARR